MANPSDSVTPRSPADSWPTFAEIVHQRLEAGRAYEATSPAVERSTLALIVEIQEELADVCGWSAALWSRLEALKERAARGGVE